MLRRRMQSGIGAALRLQEDPAEQCAKPCKRSPSTDCVFLRFQFGAAKRIFYLSAITTEWRVDVASSGNFEKYVFADHLTTSSCIPRKTVIFKSGLACVQGWIAYNLWTPE